MTPGPLNTLGKVFQDPKVTFVTVILLTIAGGIVGFLWGKNIALSESVADLNRYSELNQQKVGALLNRYELMPEIANSIPSIAKVLKTPYDVDAIADANQLLENLALRTHASVIYIMNTDGTTVVSSNWDSNKSFVGKNYGIRPYFQEALKYGKGQYVALGLTSKKLGFYQSKAVKEGDKVIGVVVIKINLDELGNWLKNKAVQTGIHTVLSDEDNIVFLSSVSEWQYRPLVSLSEEVLANVKKSRRYEGSQFAPLPIQVGDYLGNNNHLVKVRALKPGKYISHRSHTPITQWQLITYLPANIHNQVIFNFTVSGAVTALALAMFLVMLLIRSSYRQQLLEVAIKDPLTGLYSRFYMNEIIPSLIAKHSRDPNAGLVVILLDLDHFKQINDNHGHLAGDKVLQVVGEAVRDHVRQSDIAARYGGEELAIFVLEREIDNAAELAERVRQDIERLSIQVNGKTKIRVTLSAGLALHQTGETMSEWIDRADKKLYQAKEEGRNKVCS